MSVRLALWALILVAAVLLAVVSASVQDATAAVVSLSIGALWLALEVRGSKRAGGLHSLFFFGLLTLAVLAALKHAAMPLTVLGAAAALAAWDLSGFSRRTAHIEDEAARAALERTHLQKLSITAGGGLVAALIPLVVQVSISFVVLALVLLVAIIALNSAVASQRNKRQRG